ncbi:CHRD domain-containing protein [Desertibaculum subflavum]|uniref:CHRD domain-containing protein n=1 Tax=Desertibaculum subflavum TaxID=2268458 RepID=UPI000E66C889
MPLRHSLAIAALLASLAAASAEAEVRRFSAALNPTQEVPAAVSQGQGTASLILDTTTRKLTWTITWRGLTGPATAAHIHGPATPVENAGVVINLAPQGMKTPLAGSAELTEAQVTALLAGRYYINVHTDQNKAGEIRGQLYP